MFLLPVFLGFMWLGRNTPVALFDTRLGMVLVYTAFFTPVAIYFLRSFFLAIPRELEEAALVDGCTPFGAFWRIVLPNALPGLVATFVYAFLFAWDELLFVASLTRAQRGDAPDRDAQLHRQLQPGLRAAHGRGRRVDAAGHDRLLRHPAVAGPRPHRRER